MSDQSQGQGWWQASDGKWYPPETHPQHDRDGHPEGWWLASDGKWYPPEQRTGPGDATEVVAPLDEPAEPADSTVAMRPDWAPEPTEVIRPETHTERLTAPPATPGAGRARPVAVRRRIEGRIVGAVIGAILLLGLVLVLLLGEDDDPSQRVPADLTTTTVPTTVAATTTVPATTTTGATTTTSGPTTSVVSTTVPSLTTAPVTTAPLATTSTTRTG